MHYGSACPNSPRSNIFETRWNPGLKHKIDKVAIHDKKRLFRGIDAKEFSRALIGATLERSEARGKQMLFIAKKPGAKVAAWMGIHLGMTGELRAEKPDYSPAKHDHLVLFQKKHALVFEDARMFGRVLFAEGEDEPEWWATLPPDLLSAAFTIQELEKFLKRRARAPIKAVLLMQERFPGIGNWMADEISLARRHPSEPTRRLHQRGKSEGALALHPLGLPRGDADHRQEVGATCPTRGSSTIAGKRAVRVRAPASSSSTPPSAAARRVGRRRGRSSDKLRTQNVELGTAEFGTTRSNF